MQSYRNQIVQRICCLDISAWAAKNSPQLSRSWKIDKKVNLIFADTKRLIHWTKCLFSSDRKTLFIAKLVELMFWAGSICLATFLLIVLINLVLQRKESTPTLTTIDSYYYPIYKVPFSAITFCNVNQILSNIF